MNSNVAQNFILPDSAAQHQARLSPYKDTNQENIDDMYKEIAKDMISKLKTAYNSSPDKNK
jgi:hypothetical protein